MNKQRRIDVYKLTIKLCFFFVRLDIAQCNRARECNVFICLVHMRGLSAIFFRTAVCNKHALMFFCSFIFWLYNDQNKYTLLMPKMMFFLRISSSRAPVCVVWLFLVVCECCVSLFFIYFFCIFRKYQFLVTLVGDNTYLQSWAYTYIYTTTLRPFLWSHNPRDLHLSRSAAHTAWAYARHVCEITKLLLSPETNTTRMTIIWWYHSYQSI